MYIRAIQKDVLVDSFWDYVNEQMTIGSKTKENLPRPTSLIRMLFDARPEDVMPMESDRQKLDC